MKICVSTESAADLSKELIEKHNIKTIAYQVLLGDKAGLDGEITCEQIINFVNEKNILPKTAAINEVQYTEYFQSILNDGYDAIVHFSLSSELSSSCGNAMRAASNFENVFVVDSLSLSTGISLLCLYAIKLANEGLSAQEIFEKCNARVPYVQASFALNRLDYLYKGGRCSSLAFFGANLLKIRPQIIVKNGKMISGKKYRGSFNHVVNNYCKDVLEEFSTPDLENVFLTYTTADKEVIDTTYQHLADRGFKNIYISRAGGTITSHCGENCLGILYINDGKE